jgi:hypothetical protein
MHQFWRLRVLSLVPFAAVAVIATASLRVRPYWSAQLLVHLVSFVVLALACHGELYRRRPEPARLTEFYLWTSFGGVIGGIFAGLIAPHVFNGIAERAGSQEPALGQRCRGGRSCVRCEARQAR